MSRIVSAIRIALLFQAGSVCGCSHGSQHDFAVVAPAFDVSRLRFTRYDYLPVGAYAEKRSDLIPFVDSNGDAHFDPQTEASGRCDPRSHQCWIDHARLRLLSITSDCTAAAGTWIIGNIYDRYGQRLEATLCDDRGNCSAEHQNAFQNMESVNAIWLSDASETSRTETLTLRAGLEEVTYSDIALPAPIRLVDSKQVRSGDLHITATADQSIDMATLWVKRGQTLHWSSAAQPGGLRAKDVTLEAVVPQAVLESCGQGCEAYLQFAHVWRDDNVLSVSQVEHKIF